MNLLGRVWSQDGGMLGAHPNGQLVTRVGIQSTHGSSASIAVLAGLNMPRYGSHG